MGNFISIMNHELTEEQKHEIKNDLTCSSIIILPKGLKEMWEQIPPTGELSRSSLNKITGFLEANAAKGDYILVQGDFGATYYIVDFCFRQGFIPVYSTSLRQYSEEIQVDGFIERRHLYKHVAFRRFKEWKG